MTEEEEQEYAADQDEAERIRTDEEEQNNIKSACIFQRMLRGHQSRSQFPEITPDMGPQMPEFLQAAAPGSDVMLDMMKDTLWETNKIGIMSYKEVYAKDRITP